MGEKISSRLTVIDVVDASAKEGLSVVIRNELNKPPHVRIELNGIPLIHGYIQQVRTGETNDTQDCGL